MVSVTNVALVIGIASATAASSCTSLSASDALLVIDVQNDFLTRRLPLPNVTPSYSLAHHMDGPYIKSGSVPVAETEGLVPIINDWVQYFENAGASLFYTLDWHPANHCSFCRNGTNATNPTGYHPHGGFCTSGPDDPYFNATGRCTDPVSQAMWANNAYVQWPDHCVQGSFGGRFDPFLTVSQSATVVKKGFEPGLDSYSGFGGVQSVQSYPFDTTDSSSDLRGRRTLGQLLEARGIRRLFIAGVATDYCVRNSVLEALGWNDRNDAVPMPSTLETVSLIRHASRGVDPSTTADAIAAAVSAGTVVLRKLNPRAAIGEMCAVTVSGKGVVGSATDDFEPVNKKVSWMVGLGFPTALLVLIAAQTAAVVGLVILLVGMRRSLACFPGDRLHDKHGMRAPLNL
eukprot:TRINITY_DN21044_c0_g1_i1.p1 TRINITY_DN21044_c0_g1~~TRINITY_DN21044_c0_g1_i1.p1  ORF type:complete len:402 (-),score=52.72 TRINITY_DN21044_c0_g1_i1:189-1394(-)